MLHKEAYYSKYILRDEMESTILMERSMSYWNQSINYYNHGKVNHGDFD